MWLWQIEIFVHMLRQPDVFIEAVILAIALNRRKRFT